MVIQLTLDFTPRHQITCLAAQDNAWLDVTDIARGVGFLEPVQISLSLNDALEAHQNEPDDAYPQRLFDCLWLAHLHWSLAQGEAAILNFYLERADSTEESRLSFRLELHQKIIRLGLPDDFQERMDPDRAFFK
ncbi:MAG: hypothetical protein ACM3XO_20250 [Bacteroidota bacterium]